jgi:hypothetical protein
VVTLLNRMPTFHVVYGKVLWLNKATTQNTCVAMRLDNHAQYIDTILRLNIEHIWEGLCEHFKNRDHISPICLIQRKAMLPIFVWCMARFGIDNRHPNDMFQYID